MEQEQANYKIGSIYKRGKFLKSWNKRSIVLNFIKGTLSLRKGSTSKEKVLHLQNYEVMWMGNTKSKVFYFKVKAVKNFGQEKYKRINLGDTDEANARMWMEQIENIINNSYLVQAPQQQLSAPTIVEKLTNHDSYPNLSKQAPKSDKINNKEVKFNNELSPSYAPGRQVLSVNKEEDYDQLLKQFESCCQYNENDASEYDEFKPHEKGVVIPNFNFNLIAMPDAIMDDPGIENICKNTPESIRAEVQMVLDAYFRNRKHFIETCLSKIGCKQVSNNIYSKEGTSYLIQDMPDMKPIEIYEEIQTPSTNEHWNEVIDSYSIQPADTSNDDNRNLSLISYRFKFDKGDGTIIDKEILSYRYSVQFANGYFIWEFQHLTKHIDQNIEKALPNKVYNAAVIFSDPSRNNVSCICMKSDFKFKNEAEESQSFNTQRFLKGFMHINKCKDVENLADEIVIECNAEQEDGEDPDEIDSHVFISVRIDRIVTTGNAEEDFTEKEISAIQMKVADNSYITDCIKAKHERRIVSGVYQMVKSSKEKGHYCWKHAYKRDEKRGGLNFVNEKLLKEQRAVLIGIIKRIGSNLLNGRSIMNVSMPVQIFDSKSMIQRLAKGFGHAPTFLEKGGLINSTIEQIKYSAAFLLSSFIMGINQEKPFNPVVGETVQARLNGCPIYFEQTSHHPAICHYIMFGRGYDLYGCHIPMVNMSANSLQGQLVGNPTIRFKNTNTKVMCIWSNFTMYNLTIGQRYLNASGRAYVFEPKNCLVLEIICNPNNTSGISSLFSKKYAIDEIQGAIYKVKPEVIDKLILAHKAFSKKTDLQIDPQNDVAKFISKAEGIWNSHLEFDGVRYWDDSKDFPYVCEYEINPLPSDSRYREDMLYFQKNDKKKSQDRKEEMEEEQRYDQKLRELYKKKRETEKK